MMLIVINKYLLTTIIFTTGRNSTRVTMNERSWGCCKLTQGLTKFAIIAHRIHHKSMPILIYLLAIKRYSSIAFCHQKSVLNPFFLYLINKVWMSVGEFFIYR